MAIPVFTIAISPGFITMSSGMQALRSIPADPSVAYLGTFTSRFFRACPNVFYYYILHFYSSQVRILFKQFLMSVSLSILPITAAPMLSVSNICLIMSLTISISTLSIFSNISTGEYILLSKSSDSPVKSFFRLCFQSSI